MPPATVRAATRRRGAELERAILDAVWELLAESGYETLGMGAVAMRAGTSKPVLYRRWANRAELVIATLRDKVPPPEFTSIDQGDLRSDLIAMLHPLANRFADTPPTIIRSLRTAVINDPELLQVTRAQMGLIDMGPPMAGIAQRAAGRGEMSGNPLPQRVIRLPLDLMRTEAQQGMPIPDEVVTDIVDQILVPLLSHW